MNSNDNDNDSNNDSNNDNYAQQQQWGNGALEHLLEPVIGSLGQQKAAASHLSHLSLSLFLSIVRLLSLSLCLSLA